MANGIEFDWDVENTKHLAAHKVTVREFESVMQNSPLDLAYEVVNGEQRYRFGWHDGLRQIAGRYLEVARWQVASSDSVSCKC